MRTVELSELVLKSTRRELPHRSFVLFIPNWTKFNLTGELRVHAYAFSYVIINKRLFIALQQSCNSSVEKIQNNVLASPAAAGDALKL